MAPLDDERREVVRAGYDQIAHAYLASRPADGADVGLLDDLDTQLAPGGRILDVGCGAGIPVAEHLLGRGYRLIGLDLSMGQLALAARRLPALVTAEADMSALPVGSGTFDALVSYYAVIHVPRHDHPSVFAEFRRVLRPGAWALLCLGSSDIPADLDQSSWLGTPMYWSHYDGETTMGLVAAAGLAVTRSWEIADPMGHGGHRFVLARAL